MYEPIKALGQNFLTDKYLADRMVASLNLNEGDTVIEIGPGLGILTEAVADRMRTRNFKLFAVEIDSRFTAKLETMFITLPELIVVNEDILNWLPKFSAEGVVKVLGSLPFYITSPIIHTIIKMSVLPDKVVLLVQKEVAEKIVASAPDSSYMSVFVQAFYDVELIEVLSRKKFKPAPKVDGAILVFSKKRTMPLGEIIKFEGFMHKAFASPRKMLNKPFTKEELNLGGIDPKLRPEALSAEQWVAFYKILHNIQD